VNFGGFQVAAGIQGFLLELCSIYWSFMVHGLLPSVAKESRRRERREERGERRESLGFFFFFFLPILGKKPLKRWAISALISFTEYPYIISLTESERARAPPSSERERERG
jgi:hypothetical protein